MTSISWVGLATLGVLYVAFLLIGFRSARGSASASSMELMLANRSMPLVLATLTMTATWVDGGYLLGSAEGARQSLADGLQGGCCFGLSLVLGGLFFARRMREREYVTLADPLAERWGAGWGAALIAPALLGEIFWSAELLVALGSTLAVMVGMNLATAIVLSALVITLYTMVGGLWSVAYTDAFQLGLVPVGMIAALWSVSHQEGLFSLWEQYSASKGGIASPLPPWPPRGSWSLPLVVAWWDQSLMLVFGGIPWNCYFQRVLACRDPLTAKRQSMVAGVLTIVLTVPPVALGMSTTVANWPPADQQRLEREPALALPLLLKERTPWIVGLLGLAAIVGAITSSYSASILSASSMAVWNMARPLVRSLPDRAGSRLLRLGVVAFSVAAVLIAWRVRSVKALWFLTSDLVYVALFPQLVMALYARRATRTASISAFCVGLGLRLGAGEPLLGLPAFLPYAALGEGWLIEHPKEWTSLDGRALLPIKTFAMLASWFTLVAISRLDPRSGASTVERD